MDFTDIFTRNENNVKDTLWEGPNISTAVNDIYLWFVGQLKKIYPERTSQEIMNEYSSPIMVMIGCESTGKSATVENLTKIPIFPTASGICTLCPIKVKLIPVYTAADEQVTISFQGEETVVDKDRIKYIIAEKFKEIESKCEVGYCNDELCITIEQQDVPRMDFVDLPGIVSFPENKRKFTSEMTDRYINNPSTFLLCVANATTPRLTSYEPIARTIQANACYRSIIVLTMADKLSPRDFSSHLINRVILETDELGSNTFSACCAVINRSYAEQNTLVEQNKVEEEWFAKHIVGPMRKHNDPVWVSRIDKFDNHVGIKNLLTVATTKYDDYVKTIWIPRTIDKLHESISQLEEDLQELGDVVQSPEDIDRFRAGFEPIFNSMIYAEFSSCCNENLDFITKFVGMRILAEMWKDGMRQPSRAVHILIEKLRNWISSKKEQEFENFPWIYSTYFAERRKGASSAIPNFKLAPYAFNRFTALWSRVDEIVQKIIEEDIIPVLVRLDPLITAQFYSCFAHKNNVETHDVEFEFDENGQFKPKRDKDCSVHDCMNALKYLGDLISRVFNEFRPKMLEQCLAAITVESMVEREETAVERKVISARLGVHQTVLSELRTFAGIKEEK